MYEVRGIAERLFGRVRRLAKLQADHERLTKTVEELQEQVFWRECLFYKAFSVSGLYGDYLEFGVWKGHSLSRAFWSAKRHFDLFNSGVWDHTMSCERKVGALQNYHSMRYIGFDSFEGLPKITGVDAKYPVFIEGSYSASEAEARKLLHEHNVNMEQVRLIKGYFGETCTEETAGELGIDKASVIHIDCDLYASTTTALEFCTPFIRDGTVIIFDEWFQFAGRPDMGEQRAFSEWRMDHPEWHAAEFGREGDGRVAFVLTNCDRRNSQ